MRKKELLKINDELFNRCESLIFKVEELKKEIVTLKTEIETLKAEKEPKDIEIETNAPTPLETVTEKVNEAVTISKETEYGAEVIGKIVIKAAKYCNQLTAETSSEITKEQVNLILGRTEVAKAEILKVISANGDFEDKKTAIDTASKSAEDYFSSVMAQTE